MSYLIKNLTYSSQDITFKPAGLFLHLSSPHTNKCGTPSTCTLTLNCCRLTYMYVPDTRIMGSWNVGLWGVLFMAGWKLCNFVSSLKSFKSELKSRLFQLAYPQLSDFVCRIYQSSTMQHLQTGSFDKQFKWNRPSIAASWVMLKGFRGYWIRFIMLNGLRGHL